MISPSCHSNSSSRVVVICANVVDGIGVVDDAHVIDGSDVVDGAVVVNCTNVVDGGVNVVMLGLFVDGIVGRVQVNPNVTLSLI